MTDKEQAPSANFTGRVVPFYFDAPLTVAIDPGIGALYIESIHPVAGVPGGVKYRVHLTPAAARELALTLKQIESTLGTPIEDLTKPDSVQ